MRFMNDFDIQYNAQRYARHPVKVKALRVIEDLRKIVNQVSDGWSYWSPPVKACAQLFALVEDMEDPTEKDYKKAITPIKAFFTRYKEELRGHVLNIGA